MVALLVVPIQMSLIPILQIYSAGNLYGSFLGIWLAHTGFGLPLAIFLLYNYMSQLPRDLFESAAIDGATHLQTFMRLVLPLSIPALGRSPSSSSCGSGTTCWWRWSSWAPAPTFASCRPPSTT